jgi:hypothetical protein
MKTLLSPIRAGIIQTLISLFIVLSLAPLAHSQYASRIMPRAADPAACTPGNGEVYYNTATNALRQCIATNTWGPVGFTSTSLVMAQGTLTASTPFLNHTATWNAGAVTFQNIVSNVTDTASAAASTLIDLQVGGVSQFAVRKDGRVTAAESAWSQAAITTSIPIIELDTEWNNVAVSFTGIDFDVTDTASVAGSLLINLQVGGVSQFAVRKEGDIYWTGFLQSAGTTFAALGAPGNGRFIYCTDCTKATPCAGAGTGALAKRINGAWDCD